jgi:hypothetical protein
MRQWTIAERVLAAVLLPTAALPAAPPLAAVITDRAGMALIAVALAGAILAGCGIWAIIRSIARSPDR